MNLKWNPNLFGWKYLTYILVAVALVTGFGVWFMPNKWAEPEIAAGMAEQEELRALRKARLAREAEEKREADELGLIYIEPGTNSFPTKPPEKAPK